MESSKLTELIKKYSNMVFRIAFSYIGNRADAEDVMQDVFVKLYVCGKAFESEEHIKAWLLRVTINQCKSLLKLYRKTAYEPIETAEHIVPGIVVGNGNCEIKELKIYELEK